MANQKISEYLNTRNTFDDGDLFDVSAFLNPGYETQKTTYAIFKANLVSAGFLSNGDVDLSYTAATRTIGNTAGDDAVLPLFTSTEAGLVPLSGGGTTNFLRADGTWAAAGGADTNFANTDLTFAASRTHDLGANTLTFSSTSESNVEISNSTSTRTRLSWNYGGGNNLTYFAYFPTAYAGSVDALYKGSFVQRISGDSAVDLIQTIIGGGNYEWATDNSFLNAPSRKMILTNSGNLGIGTTTPTAKLHVAGDTYIDGNLRIDTPTPSVLGQVWTATDGFGNGSWQTPSGADGNGIFDAANNGGIMGVTSFSTSGATTITHTSHNIKLTGVGTQAFQVENTSTSQRPIINLLGSNSRFAQFAYYPTAWSGTNTNYQDSVVLWAGNSVGNAILKNVITGTGTYTAYQIITDTIGLLNHNVRMEMNSLGEFGFGTTPVSGKVVTIGGNAQIDGTLNLTPVTAPANPSSGFVLYVDSADGDLKAKSSTGVTTTLALN